MSTRKTNSYRARAKSLHRCDVGFIPTANRAYDSITVTRNRPLISGVKRKRLGKYCIQGGSFSGGVGCRHDATAKKLPIILSQRPHRTVLMRLTKELGWEAVHRYFGLTKYVFVPMRLPIRPTEAMNVSL
jgi:hypothetical protein